MAESKLRGDAKRLLDCMEQFEDYKERQKDIPQEPKPYSGPMNAFCHICNNPFKDLDVLVQHRREKHKQ